jgi:hypothetical protein
MGVIGRPGWRRGISQLPNPQGATTKAGMMTVLGTGSVRENPRHHCLRKFGRRRSTDQAFKLERGSIRYGLTDYE